MTSESSASVLCWKPSDFSEEIASRPVTTDLHQVNVERVSWYSEGTVVQAPCQISFGLVSSRAPGTPSSRPYPEALNPPNGARGSQRVKSLINTIPDSISPATRRALTRSRLQPARRKPTPVVLRQRGGPPQHFAGQS